MGKGCKVLLIVGIILLAIIIVGVVLGYTYCDQMKSAIATKTVDQMEKDVLANLPEGFNVDDAKSTIKELRDKVQSLIAEKKLDFTKMTPMINEFTEAMKDKKLTTEEATRLFEKIKEYIDRS